MSIIHLYPDGEISEVGFGEMTNNVYIYHWKLTKWHSTAIWYKPWTWLTGHRETLKSGKRTYSILNSQINHES